MSKRITLAAAAALAAAVVGSSASAATPPTLTGITGPGFTITLQNASHKKVTTLKPGAYRFVVQDKSNIHNFHLIGPGVNKMLTGIGFKGTSKAVTITLKKGTYHYQCDPHAQAGMKGSFTVK